jgi:signal transduction histidine kinase
VRQDGAVLISFRRRVTMLLWSGATLGTSLAALVVFCVTLAGAALITVWVGIPILVVTIGMTRVLANHRRRHSGALVGRTINSPYLRKPTGSPVTRIGALAVDPAVRRDMVWLLVEGTVGLVLSVVALVEGILDLIFWWLPPAMAATVHARLDCALLAESEKSRLAQRVQQLTESRAETVETQAAELRRIERDLHDGAQARLVALGMSLAMAEEQLDTDPAQARALLAEARASSSTALSDLRDLVRGIHPPVLADRGLAGAVQALALTAPVPVHVSDALDGRRAAPPVESAAYFAIAEALANVIKHSGARSAAIDLALDPDALRMTVTDDGTGGADPERGTGLRGVARRLAAFDGTLEIDSPPGGPTRLAMVLPCAPVSAPSSPKTSPSSGTA